MELDDIISYHGVVTAEKVAGFATWNTILASSRWQTGRDSKLKLQLLTT